MNVGEPTDEDKDGESSKPEPLKLDRPHYDYAEADQSKNKTRGTDPNRRWKR